MATTTKEKGSTVGKLNIEVEETVEEQMRGRGLSAETLAVREQLEAQLESRTARSFTDVPEDKKEEFARVVRSAGKAHNGKPEIKVSTRYSKSKQKLYWGPTEVMNELSAKNKSDS